VRRSGARSCRGNGRFPYTGTTGNPGEIAASVGCSLVFPPAGGRRLLTVSR
jgi:hypothetical protein